MAGFQLVSTPVKMRKELAFLAPRAALGASMLFHGYGKLAGEGPKQAGQMMESVDLKPGKQLAIATGIAEVFAGISSIFGIWTRPAALAVLVTQAVALGKVHLDKGYDITKGGYEYNIALMAIAAGMLLAGPGSVSAHEAIEHAMEGRGAKRLFRKAKPSLMLRLVKLLK